MSYNGSGAFQINTAGQPVVATTTISASVFNAFTADVATGLSTAICKDGQTTITANIPFNDKKITGLAAATARTDAASLATIQDGTGVYVATVGGTADAITLTPSPAITSYAAGQEFWWIASGANTTAATLQVSGIASPKAIKKNGTTALIAGDIPSGKLVGARYDGTNFQLVGSGDATNVPHTLADAKGDLIAASAADTFTRLAVGTNGQVLTADSAQSAGFQYRDVGIPQEFRLSLTTAVPVTTSDVTGAGTLYCVPYVGNRIGLYDGTSWNIRTSNEFSLALTLTSGKPYDVFCYDNAGTPTLEVLVWTNDTTRATALTTQNGVLVKTGALTRRYLGTLYASGANTTEDSLVKRYLWNYYHRRPRPMKAATETANSWNYTTAAWQQANANAANQLDYVQGVSEDPIEARVLGIVQNAGATNVACAVGIGLDATNANSAQHIGGFADTHVVQISAFYQGWPGVGRHFLAWVEYSTASGTTTWRGDDGGVIAQSGIMGTLWG